MVNRFRRSISFSNPSHSRPSPPQEKKFHVRSTSLPCRSHPLFSRLNDEISELRTWASSQSQPQTRTSAWLCDGLSRLVSILDSLDDVLQLSQTQDSLRTRTVWLEKLLEDFFSYLDAYGAFQNLLLTLKEELSAAQVGLRRKDESKVVLFVKFQRKLVKEMSKLLSAVRSVNCRPELESDGDVELAKTLVNIKEVTAGVSVELFSGILSPFAANKKASWIGLRLSGQAKRSKLEESGIQEFEEAGVERLWNLRKKSEEEVRLVLKKMQNLEGCVCDIESGSEKVLRRLIHTRVSLLNILTQ
ncbi:Protein BPS1, chloroplastic [Dillenia turbinata]|uniref:Protein BPS1, chloroplastic n=1 Tax=Dillenia turbinata TaxID=194707 RepID=A0AAN8ZID8_9MAGN